MLESLYDLPQQYFIFIKGRKVKCYTKIYLQGFQEIYNGTAYTFENIEKINRRMCNCFFKAFKKRQADKANNRKDNTEKTIVSKAGAQPEIFQGRGGFVELGHFDKLFVKNTKKRSRSEKFWSFFS